MAENKLYVAIGEEAARGTKEVTTVGYIPLNEPSIPTFEPEDIERAEYRGEDVVKGVHEALRKSRKWSASLSMPLFTEAGTTAGMVGTIAKHFFGHTASDQNGATSQYFHMLSAVTDPFLTANLGAKALTANLNINEGTSQKNWPYVGGRITTLNFSQEINESCNVTFDMVGQFRDTVTAELGSEVFAAENIRCDYNNLSVYTGTITRTGTGPDYTDITFGSATQLKPDTISVSIENGMEDNIRLGGLDYADKTRMGKYRVTIELTIDWEDPASGFSSVDEYTAFISSLSETNFALIWDTGTQAGTGDNHSVILDIPRARRTGGDPEYSLDNDPMITLTYEGLYDHTTTKYIVGMMLKNTASAI